MDRKIVNGAREIEKTNRFFANGIISQIEFFNAVGSVFYLLGIENVANAMALLSDKASENVLLAKDVGLELHAENYLVVFDKETVAAKQIGIDVFVANYLES